MIKELAGIVLAIAVEVPKLVRRKPIPKPDYKDPHHWTNLNRDTGDYVPEHCIYCKQARAVATKYCPGVPA